MPTGYSGAVSPRRPPSKLDKLDKILQRNRAEQRRGRRKLLTIAGVIVALIVIALLLTYTDLGQPPVPKRPAVQHVDGIYLGKPHAR